MSTPAENLPRPNRGYLVCAAPRSGSTMLCEALVELALAGRPREFFEARRSTGAPRSGREFFDNRLAVELGELVSAEPPAAPWYSALRDPIEYREHLRFALEEGTTENGVFGAKLMWMHTEDFLPLCRTLPELGDAGLREAFDLLFARPAYIWVRRYDTVRQAVSLWRAIQTQAWRGGDGSGRPVEERYNFAAIAHLCDGLLAQDAAWERFFARERIVPVELLMPHIVEDLGGSIAKVLLAVDVEPQLPAGFEPPTERQSDDLTERWIERFETEAAA